MRLMVARWFHVTTTQRLYRVGRVYLVASVAMHRLFPQLAEFLQQRLHLFYFLSHPERVTTYAHTCRDIPMSLLIPNRFNISKAALMAS